MSQTKSKSNPVAAPYRWPEGAVVYQIYPRSFYDANNDGIGDIPGIIKKLNYIKDLGVTVIWLSPFYPSPMADFGYDVADYCDVDPIFGTLGDMDKLLAAAHKRDIKIMVDLVPNHSSDEHEWFRQSKQSREGRYADWYIWKDPKGHDSQGNPLAPNNWIELFNGDSVWEWEPLRQQFYLHTFDVRQPDLNWANPEVRAAIKDAMRFWLDKGVDGFRVDAVHFMGKDTDFRDEPENPDYVDGLWERYSRLKHIYNHNWPVFYDYLAEMADVLKEDKYTHRQRFMVTEAYPDGEPVAEYMTYYKMVDAEVAAPFNFEGLSLPWQAEPWADFLQRFHAALAEFNPHSVASYAFGNHDQSRMVTRMGVPAARSAAVLLLTLPGMAFIYNGDELGMKDGAIPPEYIQDPRAVGGESRDPERTPLQWSEAIHAGFSKAKRTWLPVSSDYKEVNVEAEARDPLSFLSLYRSLTSLRAANPALHKGDITVIASGNQQVLAFTRHYQDATVLVLVNFASHKASCEPAIYPEKLLVSSDPLTVLDRPLAGPLTLHAHEAALFTL